ncbi:MAG: family 10 glycosylhydrolase [Melioribacteraceae bacterium]|nr:family 10 glycosylhydrolase [Melioribacteraceae bacterium]
MKSRKYNYTSLIFFILISISIEGQSKINTELENLEIPREFRAAWVATVANINWPSSPGLPMEVQKKEAISLLNLLDSANYNAVIFQVRPQADALYKSDLEPWSYFLTGEQGTAPDDYYDPLEFWVEEAHKRSIELHAWINPYRAHHKNGSLVSDYSIVKKKPELVVSLKEGYWWFDPSIEEVQDHLYTVVMDIARRYDIDGIHFDDYFYPYPSYNEDEDFPDSTSWNLYLNGGGKLSRNDWRRDNVNKSIERIYTNLKLMKPHVKFGLSPFGIWRPNNPKSIKGFDQYDKLFADAKLWLNKGWIDYWSPQLYWTINDIDQSFPVLLNWWKEQNFKNRHVWPGINIDKGSDELENQIMITRGMLSENPGTIHWSIAPLVNDKSLSKSLVNGPYKNQALVPSLPWLNIFPPGEPNIEVISNGDSIKIIVSHSRITRLRNWVLYTKYDDNWNYQILGIKQNVVTIPNELSSKPAKSDLTIKSKLDSIAISVVDKFGNESKLKLKKIIKNR